jgi:hypothetical protein
MSQTWSWWQLGEGSGHSSGGELPLYQIECAFCAEADKWSLVGHHEKKKPNSHKRLNFDTLKCESCGGFIMVLWSTGEFGGSQPLTGEFGGSQPLTAYRVLPWRIGKPKAPDHWPQEVRRLWPQAHSSLQQENWDASVVIARSALQAALRDHNAQGRTLHDEVKDLTDRGLLPPLMKDWANELRVLGNESAHPELGAHGPTPKDAEDVVEFLDFLLKYLYDLPKQISDYRSRRITN